MTGKMFGQVGPALRRATRCAPAQYLTLAAILAISAPGSLLAADNDSDISMQGLCELSGGTFTSTGNTERCCWANWGCLTCTDTDGECTMNCDTDLCCARNGDCTTLEFPELIADPGDDPNQTILEQLEPGDTLVAVDEAGQFTLLGDDVAQFEAGDRLVVEDDAGQLNLIGDVVGQYTPIGDHVEVFETAAPDFQREDLEPQSNSGPSLCGAGIVGSLPIGWLGLLGMVAAQRGNRYQRSPRRH